MEDQEQRLKTVEQHLYQIDATMRNHDRRLDTIASLYARLGHMEAMLARLEERIEGLQQRVSAWQSVVWALLVMLIAGVVAAGFELMRR